MRSNASDKTTCTVWQQWHAAAMPACCTSPWAAAAYRQTDAPPASLACSQTGGCLHAGTFKLTLHFSEEYPNKAPVVKFVSNIFHPNGVLCCLHALLADNAPLCPCSLHGLLHV